METTTISVAEYDRLVGLAYSDPLTGFGNRAALERDWCPGVGLLLADVDDLKATNDVWGHAAGDQVIQALCDRLGVFGRVYRIGGDEVVLLGDTAAAVAGLAGFGLHLSGASSGCGVVSAGSLGEALASADAALYAVKGGKPGRLDRRRNVSVGMV